MTSPAASDPLLCRSGPTTAAPQAMAWWERQRRLAVEWMLEEEDAGRLEHSLASYAASCLLMVVEHRAIGHGPGELVREPSSWKEIDAYEILFESIGVAGGHPFWEVEDVLRAVGWFAAFLGRRGEIGAAEAGRLEREYPVWMERLLEVLDTGAWYERGGGYRAPDVGGVGATRAPKRRKRYGQRK